jgi:hypothetical protein
MEREGHEEAKEEEEGEEEEEEEEGKEKEEEEDKEKGQPPEADDDDDNADNDGRREELPLMKGKAEDELGEIGTGAMKECECGEVGQMAEVEKEGENEETK